MAGRKVNKNLRGGLAIPFSKEGREWAGPRTCNLVNPDKAVESVRNKSSLSI